MRSGKAGKKILNYLGFTTLRSWFCEHCKLAKDPQYWEAKELVLIYEREILVEIIVNLSSPWQDRLSDFKSSSENTLPCRLLYSLYLVSVLNNAVFGREKRKTIQNLFSRGRGEGGEGSRTKFSWYREAPPHTEWSVTFLYEKNRCLYFGGYSIIDREGNRYVFHRMWSFSERVTCSVITRCVINFCL